jgi:hypothetical protein
VQAGQIFESSILRVLFMSSAAGAKQHLEKYRTTGRRYRAFGVWLPARFENRHALMVASVLAVVDLKRAGFRYGHGELTIPTGEAVRPIRGPEPASYCGSPAELCAREADEPAIGLHGPPFPRPAMINLRRLTSTDNARRTRRRRTRK